MRAFDYRSSAGGRPATTPVSNQEDANTQIMLLDASEQPCGDLPGGQIRVAPVNLDLALRERIASTQQDDCSSLRDPFRLEGVRRDGGVTLHLHGEVNVASIAELASVLDGWVLPQPTSLVVDVSDIAVMSLEALEAIGRYSQLIPGLIIRSPSAMTRVGLTFLGYLSLIEQGVIPE
jgi:hypothetical protein